MASKEGIAAKIADIETAMGLSDFWSDKDKAQATLREYQDLKAALAGGGGYDKSDAIVSIISGAGGDDAEDFSRILYEMYGKYIASRGWKIAALSSNQNSMGGYRSISFEVSGSGVYGALKHEAACTGSYACRPSIPQGNGRPPFHSSKCCRNCRTKETSTYPIATSK